MTETERRSFVETPRDAETRPIRTVRWVAITGIALLSAAAAAWSLWPGEPSTPRAVLPPREADTVLVASESAPRQLTGGDYEYPEALWDARVEGEVMLRVLVSAAGGVDSVRVERSSGHEAFDSVAVRGTWRARFTPAMRNGAPEDRWMLLPVRFDLGAYR